MQWLKCPLSDFKSRRGGRCLPTGSYWGWARGVMGWHSPSIRRGHGFWGMNPEVAVHVAPVTQEKSSGPVMAWIEGVWQPLREISEAMVVGEEVVGADPRRVICHQTKVYAQGTDTLVIPIDPQDELLQWAELVTYRGLCFIACLLAGLGLSSLARDGMSHPASLLPPGQPGPQEAWLPSGVAAVTVASGESLSEKPRMHFVFWGDRRGASRMSVGALVYTPIPSGMYRSVP